VVNIGILTYLSLIVASTFCFFYLIGISLWRIFFFAYQYARLWHISSLSYFRSLSFIYYLFYKKKLKVENIILFPVRIIYIYISYFCVQLIYFFYFCWNNSSKFFLILINFFKLFHFNLFLLSEFVVFF